ncbi:rhomboid family intramembrane serine protease [Cytobacillus firmus]|nr:rhomboid family intramembrane serine protease [Cytobacillus firmus]
MKNDGLIAIGSFLGNLVNQGEWFRFITATFLHNGISHLLFNVVAILLLAPFLERLLGKTKFSFYYVLFGIGSYIAVYFFDFSTSTVGASGSIFGFLGFYLATGLRKDSYLDKDSKKYIIIVLISSLCLPLFMSNISIPGHIGGLLTGIAFGIFTTIESISDKLVKE